VTRIIRGLAGVGAVVPAADIERIKVILPGPRPSSCPSITPKRRRVIGFEKLNFSIPETDRLRVALETTPA
jgi:hypothetical protein